MNNGIFTILDRGWKSTHLKIKKTTITPPGIYWVSRAGTVWSVSHMLHYCSYSDPWDKVYYFSTLQMQKIRLREINNLAKFSWQNQDSMKPPKSSSLPKPNSTKWTCSTKMYWILVLCKIAKEMYTYNLWFTPVKITRNIEGRDCFAFS